MLIDAGLTGHGAIGSGRADLLPRPHHWPGRSPVQSVNEVEDSGGTVWLEERVSMCERLLLVPPTQEMGCVVECHCVPLCCTIVADFQ